MGEKIKVVVVDDHPMIRAQVISGIKKYPELFTILGEAATGLGAISLVEETNPDVLVLDLHMKGAKDGYDVINALAEKDIRIIVLTGEEEIVPDIMLKRPNVVKFLQKELTSDEILVENLLEAMQIVPEKPKLIKPTSNQWGFTNRQMEVFALLGKGMTNPEIAATLGMSERTVTTHLTHIYPKLGVRGETSRIDAVLIASKYFRQQG
jgi:DNA-binding NarL/FixJ family response regulator